MPVERGMTVEDPVEEISCRKDRIEARLAELGRGDHLDGSMLMGTTMGRPA